MSTKIVLLLFIHATCANEAVVQFLSSPRVKRESTKSILDEPKCGEIKSFCGNVGEKDDILILECLQAVNPSHLDLNEECQNVVWSHIRDLVDNDRVKEILFPKCKDDLSKLNCNIGEPTSYLKCIVNNKENILSSDCSHMVLRLENVAFQDYRWISSFLQHCDEEIDKLKCGRIDVKSYSQATTISCLQTNILNIKDECKREVFRLSELQSDSIKLDHQLYLECAEDHSRYCSNFFAGSGRVFTCLLQQDQTKLAPKCRQQLLRRQKLIAQDYRVSKGLMRACRDDIKKTHCRRQTTNDNKTVRLAQILLCLENVVKNGTRIEPVCEAEILDHRKMLMEDFRLSPEIVDGCKKEIGWFCQGFEVGGKTIHCLMNRVSKVNNLEKNEKSTKVVGDQCRRALESLVKQTDAGENWSVDPVLHQACYPVVKAVCKDVKGGDARVMSCLMDNIGADHMTEDCEDALMQIQYFVARDFKLDPQLYRECKDDAAKHCHASREWNDNSISPSYTPEVLPCLYRYAYHPEDNMQLNITCLQQIKRVMRQRAISVDLQPEVEDVCLSDLALFCHDKIQKGEEMKCLQDNLEDLQDKCHEAVESFTEAEGEHAELNPYIMKHCPKEMETLCSNELKNDEGDIMECLISHKNDPVVKSNPPCRTSIEHFQLISQKDYRFTYKFKIACKTHAMRLCETARTKYDVVVCLSEQILNATIKGVKSVIPKDCRQQLKAQLFQQRENIKYDPKLKKACSQEISKYCSKIQPGNALVLECLQTLHEKLSKTCEQEVFKIKKQEVYDNSVDYALITMCADTIEEFCPHHQKDTVLECLKRHRDEKGFNKKCRQIVTHRMVEQNSNYQLNPSLQQSCSMDISKFCKNVLQTGQGKDINGPVIKCLKESFKLSKLSNKCEKEMASILREQALDLNLNPLIRAVCKNELETICKNDDDEESGDVEECLKDALVTRKIATPECRVEVANMIGESQADIQVDPLLQRACALDLLNYCHDIVEGNGRHVKCLKTVMDNSPKQLSSNCRSMLMKRLEMYKNAAAQQAPPEDFHELYNQVVASPSKHYFFLMILMLIGTIFVIGMFCGRVSKKERFLKNK